MKLETLGTNTSEIEVANVDSHGIWLLVKGKEYFLSYKDYPWFENARINDIIRVELLHGFHLYWPLLDVDLDLSSLEHPSETPLTYH